MGVQSMHDAPMFQWRCDGKQPRMTRSHMLRRRWSARRGPLAKVDDVGNDAGMVHDTVGIVSRQKAKKASWAYLVCPSLVVSIPPACSIAFFLTCRSRVCCVSQRIGGGE